MLFVGKFLLANNLVVYIKNEVVNSFSSNYVFNAYISLKECRLYFQNFFVFLFFCTNTDKRKYLMGSRENIWVMSSYGSTIDIFLLIVNCNPQLLFFSPCATSISFTKKLAIPFTQHPDVVKILHYNPFLFNSQSRNIRRLAQRSHKTQTPSLSLSLYLKDSKKKSLLICYLNEYKEHQCH